MADDQPTNWGKDELTQYLDQYRGNQFATFANKPIARDLIKIESCFRRITFGAVNPRPRYPMFFMTRAHGSYMAACGAVMGGQAYEVFPLLRACLETTAYGWYIGNDAERYARWLSRHDGDSAMAAVKSEFQIKKITTSMTAAASNIADLFSEFYQLTIDNGAHPNERGFSMNTEVIQEDGRKLFNTVLLQGDGLALDWSLRVTAQVGTLALHVFQLVYDKKFMLLGVQEQLLSLRKYLT